MTLTAVKRYTLRLERVKCQDCDWPIKPVGPDTYACQNPMCPAKWPTSPDDIVADLERAAERIRKGQI